MTTTYEDTVRRLSRQSVTKHFDAYADVDWDAPDMALDPDDPRFELPAVDPLGATDWYRSQPPHTRSRIGLHRVAAAMKVGEQFESVLKRGLLEFAAKLPNGDPEFRYVYHEVIEEAQHSLMFHEFVDRCGLDVRGMPPLIRFFSRGVLLLARFFPSLFFIFVLGGEEPIDHIQRQALRGEQMHPLVQRIMRIHVTEEARHLSFARAYLRRRVPQMTFVGRAVLRIAAPLVIGVMAMLMLAPPRSLVRTYRIPRRVLWRTYVTGASARREAKDAVAKPRRLCVELGLVGPITRQLWRAGGIWAA
jgi:P-aminobenzoate N-oxygenase AurF